jgi:hypothetical protein
MPALSARVPRTRSVRPKPRELERSATAASAAQREPSLETAVAASAALAAEPLPEVIRIEEPAPSEVVSTAPSRRAAPETPEKWAPDGESSRLPESSVVPIPPSAVRRSEPPRGGWSSVLDEQGIAGGW